jgi:glyoxylase-like metal-dependent hydrolase (beta-lactamase superfamily II)
VVEKVLPKLYRIDVPLPKNPLKALNAYLVQGDGRSLLIDTGFAREECRTALMAGLRELEVELSTLDVFVTHLHADHSGLTGDFMEYGSKIYMSRQDAEILSNGIRWDEMAEYSRSNGFPVEESEQAITRHPAQRFGLPDGKVKFTHLADGDLLEYGDYRFRCVLTPGHTPAHICLYEPDKKLLVSGDHILDHITPNISHWTDDRNPLQEYMESLEMVSRLDVDLVLPGHRNLFTNFRERIRQLQDHHNIRCREIVALLEAHGGMDGYTVASRMDWDLSYKSWEQFPVSQKWFACGEAIAHLKYLESKGQVKKIGSTWQIASKS